MARKSEDELQKHTLHLFRGDFEKLQLLFPALGASVVIRKLVRNTIQRAEATSPQPKLDEDISI